MKFLQGLISAPRIIRAERKLPNNAKFPLWLGNLNEKYRGLVRNNEEAVLRLGIYSSVDYTKIEIDPKTGIARTTPYGDFGISVGQQIDNGVEIARLKKEIDGLQKAIASKEKQLGDETFRTRAPEKIIKGLETTLTQQKVEMQGLQKRLRDLEEES